MSIIWTIIIGFLAGVVAKFLMPGSNEPSGFILTTILGILGAIVASYLGQALGWYKAGEGAGFIGAVVGEPLSCWWCTDSSWASVEPFDPFARDAMETAGITYPGGAAARATTIGSSADHGASC